MERRRKVKNWFYLHCVQPAFDFLVEKHGFEVDVPAEGEWIESGIRYSTDLVQLDIWFLIDGRLSGMVAYQWTGRFWKTLNIIQIIRSRARGTKHELPRGLWGTSRKYSDAEVLQYLSAALRNCVPEFL